jgi:cold shock CspA family protein
MDRLVDDFGRWELGGGSGRNEKTESQKIRGVVVSLFPDKGFGFIKPDDGGDDIFCHNSKVSGWNFLSVGAEVRFRKVFDDRKRKYHAEDLTISATNVREVTCPHFERGFCSRRQCTYHHPEPEGYAIWSEKKRLGWGFGVDLSVADGGAQNLAYRRVFVSALNELQAKFKAFAKATKSKELLFLYEDSKVYVA